MTTLGQNKKYLNADVFTPMQDLIVINSTFKLSEFTPKILKKHLGEILPFLIQFIQDKLELTLRQSQDEKKINHSNTYFFHKI